MSLIVDRRNVRFLLNEVLSSEKILGSPLFDAYDTETVEAILDMAQAIAEDKFLSCAQETDDNEPIFKDGTAKVPQTTKEALKAYAEAGFFGAPFKEQDGGQNMPWHVYTQLTSVFTCANTSVHSYAFLTVANANVIKAFGTEAQKATYLPPMLEGRWFGTMCLSEPQAGSSLSDIKTKAEHLNDRTYRISGTKMWISGGDQDISENIVHLVLAKIPGGPAGAKGISLFIVPKVRVCTGGNLGDNNNVSLAGLNHKMGHRGTTNAVLNFGEQGDCLGYLVGEPHKGLKYMFQMMNEARIAVGQGATMSGLAGYLYSFQYAQERPQGRHPSHKDASSPQVPIFEHADIRRLLMAQKAYVEGGAALIAYCAELIDLQRLVPFEAEKERVDNLLEILTPVAKSWPSEYCLEANKHAIQILGGYGYTREYPVERFYRDNRLNHIHEGTHAIHGLDLLGRKVSIKDGSLLNTLLTEIKDTTQKAQEKEETSPYAAQLQSLIETLRSTTSTLQQIQDQNERLANATLYLDAFGHVTVAWLWLKQAVVATEKLLGAADSDKAFYEGKILACDYFFVYELPKASIKFKSILLGKGAAYDAKPENFIAV